MEIIPKPIKESAIWLNILFYCAILVFLISIVFYFVLGHFLNNAKITVQELETVLIREKTPFEVALESEIFVTQRKINDFSKLIDRRVSVTNFFDFLEKITHPRIWITEINISPKIATAIISGQTESFSLLGQQILIFEQEPMINKVDLTQIRIGEEGGVNFEINLFFSSQLFEFKEHNHE